MSVYQRLISIPLDPMTPSMIENAKYHLRENIEHIADEFIDMCHIILVKEENTSVKRIVVDRKSFNDIDFSASVMIDTIFNESNLSGSDFRYVNFEDSIFTDCNLCEANFKFAELKNVHIDKCDIQYTDFTGSDLRGTKFTNVNFATADFSGALRNEDDHPILGWVIGPNEALVREIKN